jgi:hypothetical protein
LLVSVQNWHNQAGCIDLAVSGATGARDHFKIIPGSFNFYENMRRICFEARTPLSKLLAMVAF